MTYEYKLAPYEHELILSKWLQIMLQLLKGYL